LTIAIHKNAVAIIALSDQRGEFRYRQTPQRAVPMFALRRGPSLPEGRPCQQVTLVRSQGHSSLMVANVVAASGVVATDRPRLARDAPRPYELQRRTTRR
jgi:hypothetical protein